ncbi:MAG: ABC transporter substrate-binding protein [Polaromonas sp.]|nr:ABC transporter substrate-binding protein [Polaromonas sp.]
MNDKKLNMQSLLIARRAQPDTEAQSTGRPRSQVGRAARLLGGLMVAACLLPTHASAADPVKIGVLLPLTGPVADIGNNSRQGMVWAVEQINASGGIKSLNGAKLELVFGDTQSTPQAGLSAMQKLLSVDRVPVVTGAYQSNVTLPTTRLAERAKVPFLVFSAIADSITQQGFKYTFRPNAAANHWATLQFDFLDWLNSKKTDKLGRKIQNIAFLYENTDYGQATAKNWVIDAKARGYNVVSDLSYPAGSSNMTSTINRLRSANPDAVLLVSYVSDAIAIARTLKELSYKPPIQIATGGGHSDIAFLNSGFGVDGLFTVANWNDDISKDFTKTFVQGYAKRWNAQPSSHSAQGMANVYLLKEVIEKAASADPEAIRKALTSYRSTNVPPAIAGSDVVEFDEKTGQNLHSEIIMTQIVKGKYVTVFPLGAASTEPVLPKLPKQQD